MGIMDNVPFTYDVVASNDEISKVRLILTPPTQQVDQYRRSYVYRFDNNTVGAVGEALEEARSVGGRHMTARQLVSRCKNAIVPSVNGEQIATNSMIETWRFVMIVDTQSTSSLVSNASRSIYTGFTDSTAASRDFTGCNWLYNPNTVFVTTHYVHLKNVPAAIGNDGAINQIYAAVNQDIVDGHITQILTASGEPMYNMSPDVMMAGRTEGDCVLNQAGIRSPEMGITPMALESATNRFTINPSLKNPGMHLNNIVNSLQEATWKIGSTEDTMGMNTEDVMFSTMKDSLDGGKVHVFSNQVDPNQDFTFQDLENRYGNSLHTSVVEVPFSAGVDVMDLGANSKQNVAKTLVANIVPSLLMKYSITDIAFNYSSFVPNQVFSESFGDDRSVITVQDANFLFPMTDSQQHCNIQCLINDIKFEFKTFIAEFLGDFRCDVRCDVNGNTMINLTLLDYIQNDNAFAMVDNAIGSVTTPIIGSLNTCVGNASSLMNLANATVLNPTSTNFNLGV